MIVEAFFDDSISRRALQDTYLKMMPDFQRLCKKFHRGVASLEDVVRVYQAIAQLEGIVNTLEGIEAPEHITKLIAEKYLVPLKVSRDPAVTSLQLIRGRSSEISCRSTATWSRRQST